MFCFKVFVSPKWLLTLSKKAVRILVKRIEPFLSSDGVQDTVPQKMALWHMGYLKLKEFEKNGKSRKVPLTFALLP